VLSETYNLKGRIGLDVFKQEIDKELVAMGKIIFILYI